MISKISGVVEIITFHNEENGWTVLKASEEKNPKNIFTVVVNQAQVFVGSSMEFEGEWTTHPSHGKQFKARLATEIKPTSLNAIEKYLGSGLIKGVGPRTAEKIVDYFEEETLDVLDNNIQALLKVSGITKKKLTEIKKSWEAHKYIQDVMIFLKGCDVSTLFAIKIFKAYGRESINKVRENPYQLAKDISGIGFLSADKIALSLGFPLNGELRILAGIKHVLESSKDGGHCYLREDQILENTQKLLGSESHIDDLQKYLTFLIAQNEIKSREQNYYSKQLYTDELFVSQRIKEWLKQKPEPDSEAVKNWIDLFCEKEDIQLSNEQKEAVQKITEASFSILSGGPGCGKTTTTKVLVRLLLAMNYSVILAAPTGRAAQRMTEVIGEEAKTIHRLLGYSPHKHGFTKDATDPLLCDFLIVDETSMLDISLAASLFRALTPATQVLFIGDPDQLPSVGPGNVLSDLLNSQKVPRFHLTKIFRQAEESLIIRFAHQMNQGVFPQIPSPFKNPKLWQERAGCLFIDIEEDLKNKTESAPLEMIQYIYTNSIPKYFGSEIEIQILTPQVRGSLGTQNFNLQMQQIVNPESRNKKELQVGERIYREGDRIIQIKNNYELGVFNGDIGKILKIDSANSMEVIFGNQNKVTYKRENLEEINHAYAITIHKSQGSEFGAVIIPLTTQHYKMLYRNLIYTGLTRAKHLCVFVGTKYALNLAVKQIDRRDRQTALTQLVG